MRFGFLWWEFFLKDRPAYAEPACLLAYVFKTPARLRVSFLLRSRPVARHGIFFGRGFHVVNRSRRGKRLIGFGCVVGCGWPDESLIWRLVEQRMVGRRLAGNRLAGCLEAPGPGCILSGRLVGGLVRRSAVTRGGCWIRRVYNRPVIGIDVYVVGGGIGIVVRRVVVGGGIIGDIGIADISPVVAVGIGIHGAGIVQSLYMGRSEAGL